MSASQHLALPEETTTAARVFAQSRRQLDRAWEEFMAGATRESIRVRGSIADSWERCRASHVRLETTNAPQLQREFFEARRHDHRNLLRASAATLADAAPMLVGTDAIMLVTDPQGVVLEGVGDAAALHAGNDIALGCGGDWCESAAGTNGIGMALANRVPMLVHAGEHYCERMRSWTCAAAPILDPLDGSVAGILNLSARSRIANSQIVALSVLGARRIEQALLHQADLTRVQLMEVALEQGADYRWDAMVIVDARGRLVHASRHAARLLQDRLNLPLATMTGQPAFLPGHNLSTLSDQSALPQDWFKPIHLHGELAGHMLVIPARDERPAPRRSASRRGDEADPARADFSTIRGQSPALRSAVDRARKLAPSDLPVLVEGETGVGKELFARAIHGHSLVARGPFVTFNCGAVNRELIASELFGYAKGAFTGASAEGRAGRFELADGGTLCLDEIGELAPDLQPYLLRVLEEGVVTRIGEADVRRVNVRVIAMTNRDLRAEVEAGRFRRDLFHRLAVASVTVPPLREREGDLEELLAHFGAEGGAPLRFTPEALACIHRYGWPGNLRELRNIVASARLLAQGGPVGLDCLPAEMVSAGPSAFRAILPEPALDERATISQAITAAAGNMSMACTLLGMSRSTLYRRMDRYGLDRSQLKSSCLERRR